MIERDGLGGGMKIIHGVMNSLHEVCESRMHHFRGTFQGT